MCCPHETAGRWSIPILTGHAGAPGRGAFPILFLRVEDGRIAAAKYRTVGCGPTIACGSMLSELVLGRSIAECRELTAEELIRALDGVPPDKLHCPAWRSGLCGSAWSIGGADRDGSELTTG